MAFTSSAASSPSSAFPYPSVYSHIFFFQQDSSSPIYPVQPSSLYSVERSSSFLLLLFEIPTVTEHGLLDDGFSIAIHQSKSSMRGGKERRTYSSLGDFGWNGIAADHVQQVERELEERSRLGCPRYGRQGDQEREFARFRDGSLLLQRTEEQCQLSGMYTIRS